MTPSSSTATGRRTTKRAQRVPMFGLACCGDLRRFLRPPPSSLLLLARRPDLPARVPEQRRDHGERDEDGDDDRARGREAHLGQHRDVDDGQAHQRDDDGESGEDHRRARGADGPARRLLALAALGEFGTVAGDDEQGVVDADREADHHRQRRGGGAQIERVGQGGDRGDADADADERGQQRQPGRDQRAEGDDEDDRGDARCR